jgi:hypothetical protein
MDAVSLKRRSMSRHSGQFSDACLQRGAAISSRLIRRAMPIETTPSPPACRKAIPAIYAAKQLILQVISDS